MSDDIRCNRLALPIVPFAHNRSTDYVLLVAGSHTIADADWVFRALDAFIEFDMGGLMPAHLVHCNSRGAEQIAGLWAKLHGVSVRSVDPRDEGYVKKLGFVPGYGACHRDAIDLADAVVALWDGVSQGTLCAIGYAKSKKKWRSTLTYKAETVVVKL
jgi:hypothetical protein